MSLRRLSPFIGPTALAAVMFLACATGASAGSAVLVSLLRDDSQLGYGGELWIDMTGRLNAATGTGKIATTGADLANLNQMLAYDGMWIDLRNSGSGALTATETSNLNAYIGSGRRVVFVGENSAYATWNASILNAAGGGSYTGGNFSGTTPTNTFVPLTAGVNSVTVANGGVAAGNDGVRLFGDRVATLWGPTRNALVTLDANLFDDDHLTLAGNSTFANNVAAWIAGGISGGPVHWSASVDGSWNGAANWQQGFMPSVADDATFDSSPNGQAATGYKVSVNNSVVARNLLVPSDRVEVQLAGGASLTIGKSIGVGMVSGTSGILTLSATGAAAASVAASDVAIGGSSSLSVGSGLTLKTTKATAAAGSTVTIAGTLAVQPAADPLNAPTVFNIPSLSFTGSGRFDLANNELLTSATQNIIRSQLAGGALVTSSSGGALGYKDAGGGSVEVRFTLSGDADLDGSVNIADLGRLASNYGALTGATWSQGDYNYDGAVNIGDLGALATNYGRSLASISNAAAVSQADVGQVPEPASFAIVVAIAGVALRVRPRSERT